jgi:macrolide transport system ATP-binding/permease protein
MIELRNVSKTYQAGDVPVHALRDVSLTIRAGEFVAIMGSSGSGKSTLLHILGFLDRPDSGSYRMLDTEVAGLSDDELAVVRNRHAGFVFQQFHLLPRVSALENTELPLIYAGKADVNAHAAASLESVGLGKRVHHRPNELSGGEQQRVAIARALVNDPKVIFADEPTGNLDTKSEEEIIAVLKELNRRGKTIIMVTHENEVAVHAGRVITMRDGCIVSDVTKESAKSQSGQDDASVTLSDVVTQTSSAFNGMEIVQHIRQAMRAIMANKVRSLLSILGILFGVAAVIAMLALGEGARASISENLKSLGSNLLMIRAGSSRIHGVNSGSARVVRLDAGDLEAINAMSHLIETVSPYAGGGVQVVYGNQNWNTQLEGVGIEYPQMRATVPDYGRWFTEEEIKGRDKVAVLGMTVAEKLFGGKNPLGETIKVNRNYFKVIGVAPAKGFGGHRDADDTMYVPVTTAMYRVLGKDYFDSIFAEVSRPELIEAAQNEIRRVIGKRHRIPADDEEAFRIRNMSEIQEMLNSTTGTMTMLLGCIAAISLLVGGIGIMNIMLVSVTERTREIGLRKAIGAKRRDIMSQFLIEAVIMSFSGGLLGILLGAGAAWILSAVLGWTTRVTVLSVLLSTTFSVAVGIGFGLWPARKAASLSPIEALRYE